MKRVGLGSLVAAVAPKVLGAYSEARTQKDYSAMDLFGGKKEVIRKRIEFARDYLDKASEERLRLAYAISGQFCSVNEKREEIIEGTIACAMDEDGMGILFSSLNIAPSKVMGKPNFGSLKERDYWERKMREDIFVYNGWSRENLEQYVAREAGNELNRAILEEKI